MERRFLDLVELAPRSQKPRARRGLQTIGDEGDPVGSLRVMLDTYGEYIDYAKFALVSLNLPRRIIEEKVRLYRDYRVKVMLDDPTFAIAYYQGKADLLLHEVRDMGFTHVQIDTHHIDLGPGRNPKNADSDELRYMALASELGLVVVGEVGQKWPEGDRTRAGGGLLNVDLIVAEMKRLLAAGCEHVYLESKVIREAIGDYGEKERGTEQIRQVVDAVGQDNIFIEISGQLPFNTRQCHRFWAVRNFGPDVNMGGGEPIAEIRYIEAIRRGFLFVNALGRSTSRLWVKSMARNGGKTIEGWWKEEYPIDRKFMQS